MSINFDKQQLLALSQNDVKAFDYLFMLYYPKVKAFLIGFLDNKEDAEDLSQDVFIKLWNVRSTLVQVENFNAYIYKITKNTLYTHLNHTVRFNTQNIDTLADAPTLDELEQFIYATELEDIIEAAIEQMPEQQKKIFRMSRKEGKSNEEIAILLNISKRTVETHISSALSNLRKVISVFLLFF